MSEHRDSRDDSGELHPAVYLGIVGIVAWLVAAAWDFGRTAQTDYLLVVVTGFFGMAAGLPWLLWRAGRAASEKATAPRMRMRDWLKGSVEIGQGRLSGTEAALQILLPIAALAVGMTAFAIVMTIES